MGETVQNRKLLLALIANNRPLLQALGMKQLGLFGSLVRGERRADSDIDLLVEYLPGQKSFDNLMQLAFLLEELLGRRVEWSS